MVGEFGFFQCDESALHVIDNGFFDATTELVDNVNGHSALRIDDLFHNPCAWVVFEGLLDGLSIDGFDFFGRIIEKGRFKGAH